MQVWDIDDLSIVVGVYKLARRVGFKLPPRRGPKGYDIAVKIAVTAFVILLGKSYLKSLKVLEKTKLLQILGLRRAPSPASITRWKRSLELYARALIRQSFLMLARRRHHPLLGVIDGSGLKLTKASEHYLRRIGKKAPFLLITTLYAPEIDAIYDLVATPNCNSENMAFWNYLFKVIIYSGVFWGIIMDKRYDDAKITEWLESYGIVTFIPARGGKLEPVDGPRLRADMRYTLLLSIKNYRSLIESSFSSMKTFKNYIKSKLTRTNEYDVLIMALAYNTARLIKKGEIKA